VDAAGAEYDRRAAGGGIVRGISAERDANLLAGVAFRTGVLANHCPESLGEFAVLVVGQSARGHERRVMNDRRSSDDARVDELDGVIKGSLWILPGEDAAVDLDRGPIG